MITAEQLLAKVQYMLTEILGFTELPNIVIGDIMPGNQVAVGPLYVATHNTIFVPLQRFKIMVTCQL